ncbi:MAG TPA: hypothetical protein VH724_08270 [Candidatus Angelobacter sp.]|nr:hypothetical protein [Candidatus Angelobacter sp.]
MVSMLLALLLAVGVAVEQPQNSSAKLGSGPSHTDAAVLAPQAIKPDDPVITVSGICRDHSAKAASPAECKTIVTREQFEGLVSALAATGQAVPLDARQQLAQTYVDLLAYAEAARPSGMESSREFHELMELVRLRTLSEIHRRNLQAKYRTPSAQDMDDYYRQNPANFTEIKLRRILIPRKDPVVENQQEYEKRALQVANGLRERAANGEDFEQLQHEGYTVLGLASPPSTDMGNRRKANLLPESRDEIMALSVGGVSKTEQEAYSFVIYRVDKKTLLPEEAVKEEVARELSRQRLENALKEITLGVHPEFNSQYFVPAQSLPAGQPVASPAAVPPPDRAPR